VRLAQLNKFTQENMLYYGEYALAIRLLPWERLKFADEASFSSKGARFRTSRSRFACRSISARVYWATHLFIHVSRSEKSPRHHGERPTFGHHVEHIHQRDVHADSGEVASIIIVGCLIR
jgi:hypothetical protein